MLIKTKKEASEIAGTLSFPSKMPGFGYGLPASGGDFVPEICAQYGWDVPSTFGCPIGSILAKLEGSTCHGCYANGRGNYTYPSVQIAQTKRVVGVHKPEWVDAMVYLIEKHFDRLFAENLEDEIDFFFCNEHRMPTRTETLELEKLANHNSAFFRWHDSGDVLGMWHLHKIFEVCNRTPYLKHWLPTRETTVVLKSTRETPDNLLIRHSAQKVDGPLPRRVDYMSAVTMGDEWDCHAPENNNECGPCRKCWEPVKLITYPLHL